MRLALLCHCPRPREGYLCEHELIDIIAIALCAATCGADNGGEVEAYGRTTERWLGTFLV
ncbi:MAG: transposase family protein, partial [Chloroflexi bacterium]|nr:transposase family protein [Chloroflexota bacterium]